MARPVKNNAEYFSHDADMRNDDRIKAVRKKFKSTGYAIYNMLLEYLTDKDYFRCEYNDLTFELMSGDFDEDPGTIKEVIDYCLQLGLLQQESKFIRCKTLENRLEAVLLKRKRSKKDVSVTETTQSKVKKSKVFIEIGEKQENYIIIPGKYAKEKHRKIYSLEEYFHSTNQLENFKLVGWTNFAAFMSENPGRMFNDDLHLYNTFKDFSGKYLPPPRAPTEFINAEVDKANLKLDEWEKLYAYDLKHNEKFKNHFGYNGKLSPSQSVGSNDKR